MIKKKAPLRYRIFVGLIAMGGRIGLKKYAFSTTYLPKTDEPFIMICNHTTDFDFIMAELAAREPLYYVCDDSALFHSPVGKILKFITNPITVTVGDTGTKDIKNIIKRLKDGYNVCIFPEGRHSYNGITAPCDSALAKLVRLSGATLVTYRIKGGFFFKPRWSRFKRKGQVFGEITGIYSSEKIKEIPTDKLTKIINQNIYEDAYETQNNLHIKYLGKNKAVGLDKYAFICPCCNSTDTIVAADDNFWCTVCSYKGVYDDYGYLSGDNLPYNNVRDWGEFVEKSFTKFVEDEGDSLKISHHGFMKIGDSKERLEGNFIAYKDRFEWGDKVFLFKEIKALRVQYADILNFRYEGVHYNITGDSFYAWKYAKIWNMATGSTKAI